MYVGGGTSALLRFDPQGHPIRTNKLEGVYEFVAFTFDASGNLYLTGRIETNGLFDVAQVHGFFVAKFSPEHQLLWVLSQGLNDTPNDNTRGTAIAVDPQGNVFVGAQSAGPLTLGNVVFADGQGPLLCKYDPSGQLLWAKRIEYQSNLSYGVAQLTALSVDSTGHIVASGFMHEGVADFGGTTVFPGSTGHGYGGDFYIARFKPNGDLDWVQLGYGRTHATDGVGNIYLAWDWAVDGLAGLAKLNSSGDLLWSKTFTSGTYVNGLALNPNGEPVFGGSFEGTTSFDGINLVPRSAGFTDFFLAKANAQGSIQWAISGGGTKNDGGDNVVCDLQGNIYFTGFVFESTGSFGGWPLVPVQQGGYLWTSFAAKISQQPPLKIASTNGAVRISWPVQATNYVLEAATSLPAVSWNPVTNNPTVSATERSVQLPITGAAKFFRLKLP